MEIRRVRLSDAEVAALLVGLTDEYDARYGQNLEMTRASADEFDPPSGLFIVLMDGADNGCRWWVPSPRHIYLRGQADVDSSALPPTRSGGPCARCA